LIDSLRLLPTMTATFSLLMTRSFNSVRIFQRPRRERLPAPCRMAVSRFF
jgi:hypothetical protein